jgi:alpha-ketoglutaric semialdehyde dehydrogenase
MSTFRSTNPARPSELVVELPEHSAADVDRAVQQAAEAQRAWAARPVPERAEAVAAVGAVLTARKAELAELVSREAGKVRIEGGGEVQEAIDMAAFVAGQGRSAMGEVVPSELPNKLAWTTRIPVGVVGMITPWNFPVAIPSWKIFPALLAGNGV